MTPKSQKTPSDQEMLALAKQILALNRLKPNNYDLGESVRSLVDLALSNPSLLINNQKSEAPDEQAKDIH